MYLLCIVLSPHVVTLAPLYDSSPEESLHVPIEFLAIECTGVEVLVVVKVIVDVLKPNRPRSGCSKAVVGGAVSGSSATVHLRLPGSCRRVGHCRDSRVSHSPCRWCQGDGGGVGSVCPHPRGV